MNFYKNNFVGFLIMDHDEGLDHPNIHIQNSLVKYLYDVKMDDLPGFIDTRLKSILDSHIAVVVSTLFILLLSFY